jgi:putative spermidine/putrescine transport system substrate-binding protein
MRLRQALLGALAAALIGTSPVGVPAFAQVDKPPLTMVSFGGAFTRSQMLAYVLPYREETGRRVAVEDYMGGLDEIRRQVRSANPRWDVVSLDLPDAVAGCAEGLLEPIDHAILAPAPDGTPARDDFYDVALQRCGVGFDVFATVIAYDEGRFAQPPTALADFFDLDRFPGRRALQARPQVNLEWALIADGVSPDDVYDVLATEAGLVRAFDVLDRIRGDTVWWQRGEDPVELLASGQVALASAWNGRIFDAVERRGSAIGILWDHPVWNMDVWAIVKDAVNGGEAREFIAFATTAERMAAQADLIAYGPARRSAGPLVDAAVRPFLPTADGRAEGAIRIDYGWWAEHQSVIGRQFDAWLRNEDNLVYDFNREDGN